MRLFSTSTRRELEQAYQASTLRRLPTAQVGIGIELSMLLHACSTYLVVYQRASPAYAGYLRHQLSFTASCEGTVRKTHQLASMVIMTAHTDKPYFRRLRRYVEKNIMPLHRRHQYPAFLAARRALSCRSRAPYSRPQQPERPMPYHALSQSLRVTWRRLGIGD